VGQLALEHPETGHKLLQLVAFRLRRGQLAQHLDGLFGKIEPQTVRRLIKDVEWVHLSSGMTLYDGDSQDRSVYVVLHGRLRITATGDSGAVVVSEAGKGDLVGEERLLGGGPSSLVVSAARETQVARLSSSLFERLLSQAPRGALELTRSLARRSQKNRIPGSGPSLTTLAVIPASRDVDLSDSCRQLAAALSSYGTVCVVDSRRASSALGLPETGIRVDFDDPRLLHWLSEVEREHDFVLYQSDRTWTWWTQRSVQHADVVLITGRADRDPRPGEVEEQIRISWRGARPPKSILLLIHPAATRQPSGTGAWLARRRIDGHIHVRQSSAADYARAARLLTGNAFGLVLGGGGARSFAHIGVIRALEELGIEIDAIGGTSFGACVAATFAIGNDSRGIARMAETHFSGSFIDLTLPLVAFLRGRGINSIVSSVFGAQQIEDLWHPFFCVSTNLIQGRAVVHRQGSLARAVRSTIAIPGVVPPVVEGSDLLVDGGLINNVPADLMRGVVGRGRVLAVDVSPEEDLCGYPDLGLEVSGWSLLRRQFVSRHRRERLPTIASVLSRSTVVSSLQARSQIIASGQADLYLNIPTRDYPMMGFSEFAPLIELGYEASRDELRQWLVELPLASKIA
jgi:predicted acylesterase/phospholipase RssA/CRP-like cAMP-binding protein